MTVKITDEREAEPKTINLNQMGEAFVCDKTLYLTTDEHFGNGNRKAVKLGPVDGSEPLRSGALFGFHENLIDGRCEPVEIEIRIKRAEK